MKKGIVAILVILALIVFVSPGLVGHLAERSVEQQLQWAANENREVVVTSEKFDRGWFSSEGLHRVAIGNSAAGESLKEQLGFDPLGPAPSLLIDTRLDHGLIPVSSMTRDKGSLLPGLGRAVSTLSIESVDGEVTKLPGVIYSSVDLDGGMTSHYVLDGGTMNDTSWGSGELKVAADARARHITANGGFDSFTFQSTDGRSFDIADFALSSDLSMTDYGYAVGDMSFAIDSVTIESTESNVNMGPIAMVANTTLDGDRIDATTTMNFAIKDVPPIGDIAWTVDVTMRGMDASAAGRAQRAFDSANDTEDPMMLFGRVEKDLMDIAARGVEVRFNQLDVTLPQGTLFTKLDFSLPESDRQSFTWTGALVDLEASADILVPAALFELATTMNPQLNAVVAMGFLKKNGDNYEMVAQYKKALLTVNGAPMPISLPGY